MEQRVAFFNQGCRLNQAETATLEEMFEAKGDTVVRMDEQPNVVVINTCTVTENGDVDTRRLVGKIARDNPDCQIALIGCQAQILKSQLLALPNVKWVVGNAQKMGLWSIIHDDVNTASPQVIVPKINRESFQIETPAVHRRHTRANIKVQDGCDFYCAFCVIPFARGPARSREFHDTIRETVTLTQAGHRELIVTGINVGTYQDGDFYFRDLIHAMMQVPGLDRLRISSIEPTTVDWDIIDWMAADTPLCRYLHLPIQSGTDAMLSAMSRKYTVSDYVAFVAEAFRRVPGIGIGTDVIVGFPGETQALFDETYALLEALPFSYFHVFSYSERQFARSKKLGDQVSAPDIANRSRALRALSIKKSTSFMAGLLGKTEWVLFERPKRGRAVGLTDSYVRVVVDTDENLHNQLRPVLLTGIEQDKMLGQLIPLERAVYD